ncbi:MAG: phosphatidylglycerophosphatase A [Gammaproteobacteria bacterium]|nr:phosphatidylglycerophosphatase A [Gammaproteobacteria bacterium]
MAKMSKPIPVRLLRHPVHLLSLGFGSGLSRIAPGTMGTLVAVPIFWLLSGLDPILYLAVTALFAVIGVYLCGRTADALGVHDHGGIVWDEIVGYLITMALVPPEALWMLVGFILFRIFDILKPWPIRSADRQLGGGLGIMLDDVLAGIYAWLVLQFIIYLAQ